MKRAMIYKMAASGLALALAAGAGAASAQDSASGASKDDGTLVVVTGVRASMRSSVQIKKNTQEVVDSITAEDIGKLPDNNVAETLTRIPGVQGYRYGGEGASPVGQGSGLTIRGLSGQTASQVDGRSYATAGLREFNVEDAIPSMVAGIDVYKNPSAEHIEGGIGGLVNIRTRHPSDFKGPTFSLGVTARYNDLQNTVKPEIYGLFADKWDLANGGRIGLMIGATYQESEGRSDNNPANGGAAWVRSIRADDPEYATIAAANTGNDPNKALSAYVGRSDVWYLAPVSSTNNIPNTTGLTAAQIGNIMSATTESQTPVGEEIIKRTRKGLSMAADWVVNDKLRLYAETNYTYYLYNQNYMFLNTTDGRNVQNMTTTPFNFTQGLLQRNGGGATVVGQRLAGGTFLNSDINITGGEEYHPYWTAIAATGFEWQATPKLSVKGDFAVTKSRVTDENQYVNLVSSSNVWSGAVANRGWAITRDLTGTPHTMTVSSPDLASLGTWAYGTYGENANYTQEDNSQALRFDAKYDFDKGFFTDLKAGVRFAHTDDAYRDYRGSGPYYLTTDGTALANGGWFGATSNSALAYHANGISVLTLPDLVRNSLGNFMRGDAGYSGGFVVYDPLLLTGNRVRDRFPLAGIQDDDYRAENLLSRRYEAEDTSALYVMGDFAGLDGKIKGNVGVRVVKTDQEAIAKVLDRTVTPNVPVDNKTNRSYTDALPSLNVTYYAQPDLLMRFGYAKAITRQDFGSLNPVININTNAGTGSRGNPDLNPLRADSYDVSVEKYFNSTAYVSFDLFDKQLDGFTYGLSDCETVPFAPNPVTPSTANGCAANEYYVTYNVNAGKGYARGVELAGQTFFDFLPGMWKHFGAIGSFTYLDAQNDVKLNGIVTSVPLPFQSKYNYSVQGIYDDGKLSARLVYTWRSEQILFGISTNPIDGRYIGAYGILDMSVNYKINDQLSLTFNGNNLTDKGLDRFNGEPDYATGIERQHYLNGRTYSIGLRYKFGG